MNASRNRIEHFVAQGRKLYSLPAVAVKVLELTGQPHVDARALKECIENDPALTAKVLRVVNSSLFGLSREVCDLGQALALLGIVPLKLLVLGFSLSDAVFKRFTGDVMLRYWRHSLTRAVAAREIAENVCHMPGDEAFLAGLLQDIGMLVLLQSLGESYARLMNRPFATGRDLAGWEIQTLGFDHTELTSRLLADWGLPEGMRTAVVLSRGTEQATSHDAPSSLARVLHLANLLADLLVDSRHDMLAELLDGRATQATLTQSQLAELVENLQAKVAQLADVLSLELPQGMNYRDILVQAHARMSEVAAEVMPRLVNKNTSYTAPSGEVATAIEDVQALALAVAHVAGSAADSWSRPLAGGPSELVSAAASKATPSIGSFRVAKSPSSTTVDAVLLSRLMKLVQACRQSRCALSLALFEIDGYPQRALDLGIDQAQRDAIRVFKLCHQVDGVRAVCVPLSDYSWALALPKCDRHLAASVCQELLQKVRQMSAAGGRPLSVSVGLACVEQVPRNFSPHPLYDSAARCLSAAQLSGGNALKSIGIY